MRDRRCKRLFGYVKPVVGELLVKEHEFYRAVYCGICRSMKARTGALSNVTLSYDSVFLALVRMLYVPDEKIKARTARCIAHPMKKKPMLIENDAIEYTARAFSILTYYKLMDDLHDERFLKRAARASLRPILSRAKRKASLAELSDIAAEKLAAITLLEDERVASVDEPAHLFGELLGAVFSFGLEGEAALVTRECGYHLGRFIYAADAAEDYDEDRASGSYNPYVVLYGGNPLTDENRESIKCALILECKKIEGAVNLMPFGTRYTVENLIKNIIYLGLTKRIAFLDREPQKENTK